jgi:hypothetical protein
LAGLLSGGHRTRGCTRRACRPTKFPSTAPWPRYIRLPYIA